MNESVNNRHNRKLQSPLLEVKVAKPFPIWLQDRLDERDWKQADLVRATNGRLRAQTVSKWLAGRGLPPELPSIELLAAALRLTVEEVVRAVREEDPPPAALANLGGKFRDLTPEELKSVEEYADYVRSKRGKR
jgi:hypothetical protein